MIQKREVGTGKLQRMAYACGLFILASLFWTGAARAQVLVNIVDTLKNPDSSPASCTLTISWDPFVTQAGVPIDGRQIQYSIVSGTINLSLTPNIGASPTGTSYKAHYSCPNGGPGNTQKDQYWVVPASGPVGLKDIIVTPQPSPTVIVNPFTQLYAASVVQGDLFVGSATAGYVGRLGIGSNGTCLTSNGTTASWGTCASGGSGLTSLNSQTGSTQTFVNDTNVTISSALNAHTLGWTGTLAAGRLNSNVVQGITNDTNVTGTISAQNLTLGWTGTLAKGRQNATTVYTDQANTFGAFLQKFQAGTRFSLTDTTDTTKILQFDLSPISTGTTRTTKVPDANTVLVQGDAGTTNNFLTAVDPTTGVISKARPTCANLSDSAGGCTMSTTAGGDLSGTLPSPTVVKVNGTSVPTNSAADQAIITTASATAAWKAINNCGDSSHALSYSTSTHAFGCQSVTGAGGGLPDPGSNGIVVENGAGSTIVRSIAAGTGLSVINGDGVSGNPTVSLSTPVTVPNGGTSLATLTAHALYVGNGTSAPTPVTNGTSGQVLIAQTGADPIFTDPLVSGATAHDAVGTSTNPVLMGGYASAAAPSDVSADGDATRLWVLRNGSPVVNLASGGTLITGGANGLKVDPTSSSTLTTSGNITTSAGSKLGPITIGAMGVCVVNVTGTWTGHVTFYSLDTNGNKFTVNGISDGQRTSDPFVTINGDSIINVAGTYQFEVDGPTTTGTATVYVSCGPGMNNAYVQDIPTATAVIGGDLPSGTSATSIQTGVLAPAIDGREMAEIYYSWTGITGSPVGCYFTIQASPNDVNFGVLSGSPVGPNSIPIIPGTPASGIGVAVWPAGVPLGLYSRLIYSCTTYPSGGTMSASVMFKPFPGGPQGPVQSTQITMQSAVTANGNGTALNVDGYGSAILTSNCSSCAGGTAVNFEGTEDGTNYVSLLALQLGTNTIATSTTTSGITVWSVSVASLKQIRARVSAYSAGTITVTGHAVSITYPQNVVNANQGGTWTVQPGNTANTTAWKVDGSAVTQPVSGTVTSNQGGTWTVQPGNTANTTAWKVDGSAVTQPASIADGSSVTLGAKADAKSTATDTTAVTAMQVLKEISAMEQAPASRAVTNAGTFATQSAITAASGSIASGAIASGAIASGAVASGAVASGAYASGSISDGADVTLGAKADAKSTATDTTAVTVMQVLKEISAMEQAPAALATGTNSVGKISDITTAIVPGTGATNLGKAEDAAHTSGDVGVMMLGVRNDADGTAAASSGADGDYTGIATDFDGAVMVTGQHPLQWTYHEDSSSALTDTTVHASCGSGLFNYITSVVFSTGAATALNLFIEDSTTTKILGPWYLEAVAGRGASIEFPTPKKQTNSATLISVTTSAAIAHSIDIQGFCAP